MKRRLITSALPYVNNIPHLGNLIQVLSADVFARFCRSRGYDTLYVCGTDEYGTATETRAREEGVTPRELCDRYHAIHTQVYEWFDIAFDTWGRTSTPQQTEIVQDIFLKLHAAGHVRQETVQQLYSESGRMFLADRYVRGTCPRCGYQDARGDQCEDCGTLLDPTDLIGPRSSVDGTTPVVKETTHLYIDLPQILPKLQAWIEHAGVAGRWSKNALQMTQAWIRDGLKTRAITRDLKWGIPVPLEGFEDKVFYVWFDAPIGYISITATHTERWRDWWRRPDEVELFQFIGKDNIPFHTVIFPSSLLGTGERWTLLHHMSSSEYLNYEGGQFSKSRGIGVFGTDARETGIPADVWRFYIFYNRPETSDYTFTWADFQHKVNGELIGNVGNLVNRTLTFVRRYYDGEVLSPDPADDRSGTFWRQVREREAAITESLEWAGLRNGLRGACALADLGNKTLQAAEPWRTRKSDPEGTHRLLSDLVYLIRDLAILMAPYIPTTARRIRAMLGQSELYWSDLARHSGVDRVVGPEILFAPLEDELIAKLRVRYSGSQTERTARTQGGAVSDTEPTLSPVARFLRDVDLRAARIVAVEPHPDADRLYIEKLDDGSEAGRTIVSGLAGHYRPEELVGKTVVVVANLKPAKLRGVKSEGMLLAAGNKTDDATEPPGGEIVDVLFVDGVAPGTRLVLAGENVPPVPSALPTRIKIDAFLAIPIRAVAGVVQVGDATLVADGRPVTTNKLTDGIVG